MLLGLYALKGMSMLIQPLNSCGPSSVSLWGLEMVAAFKVLSLVGRWAITKGKQCIVLGVAWEKHPRTTAGTKATVNTPHSTQGGPHAGERLQGCLRAFHLEREEG